MDLFKGTESVRPENEFGNRKLLKGSTAQKKKVCENMASKTSEEIKV